MYNHWRFRKYDPDQPRDNDGKFASGSGSSGGSGSSKSLSVNLGGLDHTVIIENGRPVEVIAHMNARSGQTEPKSIWSLRASDDDYMNSGAQRAITSIREQNPDALPTPKLQDLTPGKLETLSAAELAYAKYEAEEHSNALYDSFKENMNNPKWLAEVEAAKDEYKSVRDEIARRKDVKVEEVLVARRKGPLPEASTVKSAFNKPAEFVKVKESDPLWYLAPHGSQPILDSAREAGYSDTTIREVIGAMKSQGWSGRSEDGGSTELDKIVSGHYGPAEQSLLSAIADREMRKEGIEDRTYYRKGSFSEQGVVSTTRNTTGASMPTATGFRSIGWDEKKTGRQLISEGYKPLGETYTQGYIEEQETLWVKFKR